MDSILNFVFYYNVSYKKMLQLAVDVVDECTRKILYQYIMQYVLNIGVATSGHNMRKCFDDPITNAKEMMCTKIADHDSSGYPHTEWKVDCMIHRTQTSGDIYFEGNDIKYVDQFKH